MLFEKDTNCCIKQTGDVYGEIFYKDRDLKNHNFIRHYQVRGAQSANKPLNILKRDGFVIYSINFEQHSDFYDFFNSERIVNDFLDVVDRRFVITDHVEFQAAFSIINHQLIF